MTVRRRLPAALCAALVSVLLPTMASCDAKAPGRRLHVSPHGSDSGLGTKRRPWRTLGRALRSVRPGDTVILHPGTYGRRGGTTRIERDGTGRRAITIRAAVGAPRPHILGHVRIDADHVRLERLVFAGPTGPVLRSTEENPRGEEILIWVRGDDVEIGRSEVRDSAWHAGIYITGNDAHIVRNRIHDNGDRGDPGQANLDQGIYWDTGSGGEIANNLIANNVAWGIQLYQAPYGVNVVHNTVVGNGRGGLLAADRAAGNLIANNIFAFNGRPSVTYDLSGEGNVLANNLFWANGGAGLAGDEQLNPTNNMEADPLFVGGGNYRLRPGSPALRRAAEEYREDEDFYGRSRGHPADLGAFER